MKHWHKNEKQEKINGREKAMTGKRDEKYRETLMEKRKQWL